VVAARISLTSTDTEAQTRRLYVALRPLGPAGGAVHRLEVAKDPAALLADGHTALVSPQPAAGAMVFPTDAVGAMAEAGAGGSAEPCVAVSPTGDCSGALFYDVTLAPGGRQDIAVLCPVLAGRYAVRHHWDGCSGWAQFDRAVPGDPAGGAARQPDPGPGAFRELDPDHVIAAATGLWRQFAEGLSLDLPDVRWAEALRAILGHVAMAMNEGAPDVAVANYNVFNRDGAYTTNILQKAGVWDLAAAAIDYFLRHPFNGRVRVEADNPGQVLWAMGEHWRLTRDRAWLGPVLPSARKLAALIRYCRTEPGPHWVQASSLEFGERLPPDRPDAPPAQRRQVLEPGSCDGYHPEYTDAFDIAGLPTAFGRLALSYRRDGAIGRLALSGAEPPEGFVLPLPPALSGAVTVDGQPTRVSPEGEVRLPPGTRRLELQFAPHPL